MLGSVGTISAAVLTVFQSGYFCFNCRHQTIFKTNYSAYKIRKFIYHLFVIATIVPVVGIFGCANLITDITLPVYTLHMLGLDMSGNMTAEDRRVVTISAAVLSVNQSRSLGSDIFKTKH